MNNHPNVPTGEFEERHAEAIEAGDRAWINGRWQVVEAVGAWPTGSSEQPKVEVTTEPYSDGYVFEAREPLLVAVGDFGERPKGEAFEVHIEFGSPGVRSAENISDLLTEVARHVEEEGMWEGSIFDDNGNAVGSYKLMIDASDLVEEAV